MSQSSTSPEKPLGHMVYFQLNNPEADRDRFVAGAKELLDNHPGLVHFSVGVLADYSRPVNQRDFDVSLHIVFANAAAHDAYQVAPRHKQFIAEFQPLWKNARVFDAVVQ